MIQDVAENLLFEFHRAEPRTVMRVVCECVDEFAEDDAWFIEQASRARLGQLERLALTSCSDLWAPFDAHDPRRRLSGTAETSWIDP